MLRADNCTCVSRNDFNLADIGPLVYEHPQSSRFHKKEVNCVSLNERITSVDKLRSWTDKIPFHYEYTAGVAGEKFLRGLREGKILASECPKCRRRYLPPKMYCVDCFVGLKKYREVGPPGMVSAVTESYVDFQGRRLKSPRTYVYVTYSGVTGGLVQRAEGKGLRFGDKVTPKFKPSAMRTGSLLDFEFVRITV
jgi:uncharacterized OB-fold protein